MVVERLVLRNFRGVVRGELELAPLTILVGPNNSGKTTVLEALLLAHGFRDIGGVTVYGLLSEVHRTLESDALDHLVYGYGARARRAVVSFEREGVVRSVVIEVLRDGLNFYVVDEVSADNLLSLSSEKLQKFQRIARVDRFTGGGEFIPVKVLADVVMIRGDLLRHYQRYAYNVWTDLTNRGITVSAARWISKVTRDDYLDVLAEPMGGRATLFLYKPDGVRIRLGDLGDGMQTLVMARLTVDYLDPEIVLWDDVEAHMNPRTMQLLALWLADLVDSGKQVVVTTHSLEAAEMIVDVVEYARLVKLALVKGEMRAQESRRRS